MNVTQQGMIALLKSAVTGEKSALPEQFDMTQCYPTLRQHSISAMGYAGALTCGISKDLPVMKQLRMEYYSHAVHSEKQLAAINALTDAFDKAGIDYMPLKGCNLKPLYPASELRGMSDADILVRVAQYPQIQPIMEQQGYTETAESTHEWKWESTSLYLELHKQLVPTEDKDYYRYYGDGWSVAKLREGNRFSMTVEDQFVFLFVHFAKHYRNGGIGCRHVVDLWVYQRSYPQMDEAYIRRELEALGLRAFYENMLRVIDGWFREGPWDEKSEFISQVIFASGNWGTAKTYAVSQMVRAKKSGDSGNQGKLRWILTRMFLPLEHMAFQYPVLKKWPVLLPIFWVVRWVKLLLFRSDKLARDIGMSPETLESYEQALEYAGLQFHKE